MRQALNISIDSSLKNELSQFSKKNNITRSEIVKEALRKYLLEAEFLRLRSRFKEKAAQAGFLTDEDIFNKL